jgi:hypothetical protein
MGEGWSGIGVMSWHLDNWFSTRLTCDRIEATRHGFALAEFAINVSCAFHSVRYRNKETKANYESERHDN